MRLSVCVLEYINPPPSYHTSSLTDSIPLHHLFAVTIPHINMIYVTLSSSTMSPFLCCIIELMHRSDHTNPHIPLFTRRYRHFFVRYDEPSYVKNLKVEILPLIAGDKNARDIAAELVEVRREYNGIEEKRRERNEIEGKRREEKRREQCRADRYR